MILWEHIEEPVQQQLSLFYCDLWKGNNTDRKAGNNTEKETYVKEYLWVWLILYNLSLKEI